MQYYQKRIGIFGGTFDPPHRGHIAIAEQAKKQLGLDCIYFIPAFIPPHKQNNSSTTAKHRMEMIKLAVHGKKEFKVSAIELKRKGISYTVDTLKTYKRLFPKSELMLIMGADNLTQFNTWKSPKTILKLASLVVYKRKGFNSFLKKSVLSFTILKGRMLRVSSTEIRNKIKKGFDIRVFVPHSITRYIKQHSLYLSQTTVPRKRNAYGIHRIF